LDLDLVLKILENPIRRSIVERLSQEPNYPLQLSKDLSLGQQLVAKHLKIMEESGLLKSEVESSPAGPQRRKYQLNKSVSVTIDVAPYHFRQNMVFFNIEPAKDSLSGDLLSFVNRRNQIQNLKDKTAKMGPCADILSDIDDKLEELEEERLLLLFIRKSVMSEASKTIMQIDDVEARRVLRNAVDEHDKKVGRIAEALDIREERVHRAIQKLKQEFKNGYFK
jgi:ArsR family transcriptional regulator